ncbi:MAG: Hsp20/alpha crystallin family protein [Treponema sp.]|nr:Hsp20/alpha crystallin family protein [Treponema sp.]
MKGARPYMDLGTLFDEIFEATRDFSDELHRNFDFRPGGHFRAKGPFGGEKEPFGEHVDYYPNYSYPPMNAYMTADRSLIFEFALAGFDEKDINLSFQGDYMVFSAKLGEDQNTAQDNDENVRYFKRRLKMKDIEKQKYFAPLDKYAQDQVKAVFKNGILKVTIPPKEEPDQNDGIKIEIIRDDE